MGFVPPGRFILVLVAALIAVALAAALPGPATGHDDSCSASSGGQPLPVASPDPGDTDCDGVRNDGNGPLDNCSDVRNADQDNTDSGYTTTEPPAPDGSAPMKAGDGNGDACDPDDDADGVSDCQSGAPTCPVAQALDNCRVVRNPKQMNSDSSFRGDDCPPMNSDEDPLNDDEDNCPKVTNPGQEDLDNDRRGDVCDSDDDNDTWPDYYDNCPTVSNSEQTDGDGDGIGRACDGDDIRNTPSEPTPTPGGPGGGTSSATDRTAPRVTVTLARVRDRADLRGRMPAAVRCSEACGLEARLELRPADARRMRVRRRIATGSALLAAAGRTYLLFDLAPGVARRLNRLSGRGITATLTVTAVDEAGNRRRATRRVRLLP